VVSFGETVGVEPTVTVRNNEIRILRGGIKERRGEAGTMKTPFDPPANFSVVLADGDDEGILLLIAKHDDEIAGHDGRRAHPVEAMKRTERERPLEFALAGEGH